MVAVTTTRSHRRTGRSSPPRLALVPPVVELGTGAPPLAALPRTACALGVAGGRASSKLRVSRRTYRRRRLAAMVVVAGLALVAWATIGALGGALTASGRSAPGLGTPASAQVVEVAPGDTFWSIARRLQPDGDVRPLVDRLVRDHGGAVLLVGEEIALPRS